MNSPKSLRKLAPAGFADAGSEKKPGYAIVRMTKTCPAAAALREKLPDGLADVRVWFIAECEDDVLAVRGAIDKQEPSEDGIDYDWINFVRHSFCSVDEWRDWVSGFAVLEG